MYRCCFRYAPEYCEVSVRESPKFNIMRYSSHTQTQEGFFWNRNVKHSAVVTIVKKMHYMCPYCEKQFSTVANTNTHIRTIHIRDRVFPCETCGKSFVTNGALKEHKIVHSDERPFQCSQCDKKFKNLARLKSHEDIHGNKNYECPHCGLHLNTKRTLKVHMVVHSDQKKYKCHLCDSEFKRRVLLRNHLILHAGLRPYACPFCDKTFANGSNCRKHKKTAHPIELAAMEAAGKKHVTTNVPKLEQLQPTETPDLLNCMKIEVESDNSNIDGNLLNNTHCEYEFVIKEIEDELSSTTASELNLKIENDPLPSWDANNSLPIEISIKQEPDIDIDDHNA